MPRPKPKPAAAPKEMVFHPVPELENQTLASALRRWLPGRTWTQVRQIIHSRRVMVSGNLCVDVGRRLQLSDVVKILTKPAAAPPKDGDVRVQYLDKHLIVVEKPAGVTSNRHREERDWPQRRKQIQPTLDELLPRVIDKIEGRGSRRGVPPPVRAVHRLDRDTSGLMVFARTREAERALSEQFRAHTTHRRYIAIVRGKVATQTFQTRLIRDRGDGRRGSTKEPNVGKVATTHVKLLEFLSVASGEGRGEGAGFSLIECRLETGRTHQIRIHLSEHGHPLCGEKVYLPKKNGKLVADNSGAPRLALHAAELGFEHPDTRKALRFQVPLPVELVNFWRHLKLRDETNRRDTETRSGKNNKEAKQYGNHEQRK